MENINGIIIKGKVYEAEPKGSRHCSDCDLREQCEASYGLCIALCKPDYIFRYSQPITDRINEK